VKKDGTLENRKTFAFVNSGAPDGELSYADDVPFLVGDLKQIEVYRMLTFSVRHSL